MVTGIGMQPVQPAPKMMNGNIPTAAVEPVKRTSDNRRVSLNYILLIFRRRNTKNN